jgi:translocation and assembly module TamA
MAPVRADRRGAGLRRARAPLAWLASIWVGASLGCAHQEQKQAPIIRSLDIEGTHAVSPGKIKKKILSSKTGWWPFARKQYFDPVTWETDLERIVRYYASRGYFQARIASQSVTPEGRDGVELRAKVQEGPPTRVGALNVTGLDALPPADRQAARNGLALRVGQVFDEADWEASKSGIVSNLRARGYYRAATAGEALIGTGTHLASLTIAVRPGLQYRFGDIQVDMPEGAQIPAGLVWDQVRLAIPPGSLFSDEALEEAQRRVFGMGVFASARVTPGEPDDATARLPVVVAVREGPFRTLRAGGGVKIDQIHQEARLIGEWSHRNFQGGLRRLTIHGEVGWAFLPSVWAVASNDLTVAPRNGPVADFWITFEQPRFLGHPSLREQSSFEIDRTIQQSYDNLAGRVGTGVIWQPRTRVSIFPAYRLEGDYLNRSPFTTGAAAAATAPLTLGCHTTSGSCLVWLSYLEETVTWDHRDKPLEPRQGFYASVSLQQGGGPLQGNFSYLRVSPDVRGYVSFLDDKALTFSARLRVGELWPTSGNPEDSAVVIRFYGGGANSFRGFSDRRLSPLVAAPAPGTYPPVNQAVPIGGNGIIDGSFEVRYSLTDNLRLAGFADFGQVTGGLIGARDVGDLLWAVGLGLRYLTPIGPIRVDLARRLPLGRMPPLYQVAPDGTIMEEPYTPDTSCFGLFGSGGGSVVTDSACVLQISIGEAF